MYFRLGNLKAAAHVGVDLRQWSLYSSNAVMQHLHADNSSGHLTSNSANDTD